jgi:PERQ amino acid-rich with GYF domain-containing protein
VEEEAYWGDVVRPFVRYVRSHPQVQPSTDGGGPNAPRKLSISSVNGPLASPRDGGLPSPRTRGGLTPGGFDGVLAGGGDTWQSRRRTSDATKPSGLAISRSSDGTGGDGTKSNEIKEEPDEDAGTILGTGGTSTVAGGGGRNAPQVGNGGGGGGNPPSEISNSLKQGMESLTLNTKDYPTASNVTVAPPLDLTKVEWSYIDPSGTVQGKYLSTISLFSADVLAGPFEASVMQNWHESGFFTPELRMKRTKLDANWTTVGEMIARANGGQIFLQPPPPPQPQAPPGLGTPAIDRFRQQAEPIGPPSPYQPIPQRTRNAALDTFMSGNMHTPTESPSSSFTGGRFGNGSPDPMAFGGRGGLFNAPDPIMGAGGAPRYPGLGIGPEAGGHFGVRRTTYGSQHEAFGGQGFSSTPDHTSSPAIGGPGGGFGGMNGGQTELLF